MSHVTNVEADIQEEIKATIITMLEKMYSQSPSETEIADALKHFLDSNYNPSWHVFVGKSFGSTVTHETKAFFTCTLGELSIMLFKAGVV